MTQQLEDLITGAEVARRLGVSRQRVGQLRTTAGFPEPAGKVGQAVVWRSGEIEAWARGSRNLITINGYPLSRERAKELAARVGQNAVRDPASAKVAAAITRALEDERRARITVDGDELAVVYAALQKWLMDTDYAVFGEQLMSLRDGLHAHLPAA